MRIPPVAIMVAIFLASLVLVLLDVVESYVDSPGAKEQTIFVSVPSYRDETCMATLQDMFENADTPARVFAGCCEQNTDETKEMCRPGKFTWHNNVRVVSIPFMEAKGPTYARALCADLYRGEDYFLSIDAHSKFAKGWDTTLIRMLNACPNPDKAILSHYPPGITDMGEDIEKTHVPRLCSSSFGDHGLPVLGAVSIKKQSAPKKVPYLAGGMWFAKGRVLKDVPMDPTLEYLFQGEEFLLSARCWTSGYDIYTPTANVLFHDYERHHAPRYWDDQPTWHAKQELTVSRVRKILHFDDPPLLEYKYGLGTERRIDEYYAFAGIDPHTKTSTSEDTFCADES